MTEQARKLRNLINKGEHFVVADAYSALTGRIVESVGFKAAYLGGHACSAFHYALPDNGIFSQVEQIEQAARIATAINIPLIADADTLGETTADAFHFTRRYMRAGIAGFHIEDEVNPKHSTWANGLIAIADMQVRIDACKRAREGSDLVIIARCDEMYLNSQRGGGGGSIEAAKRRGLAYAEAGADALVFPRAAPEVTQELARAMPIPLCTLGSDVAGTAFTLSTGWGWLGAAQLHLSRARELMQTGMVKMDPVLEGKDELLEQPLYDALTRGWAERTGRKTR